MYVDKTSDKCFWITGHSRGAGIANIMSAELIDRGNEVFAYTFASPNTTTKESANDARYDSIFNIVNADDFVPKLPAEDWYFDRYGKTSTVSIDKKYESEWNNTFNLYKNDLLAIGYNNDSTVNNTVNKLAACATDRNDCYKYTFKCYIVCCHISRYAYT